MKDKLRKTKNILSSFSNISEKPSVFYHKSEDIFSRECPQTKGSVLLWLRIREALAGRAEPHYRKIISERAFTLFELLVSIAIFSIITTIAVYNNAQFNSSVVLTNLSYEIALSVRQAQSYGISVRSPSSYTVFQSGYGVHFTQNSNSYILFEDKDPDTTNDTLDSNKAYDGASEDLRVFNITKGNYISKLCVTNNSTTNCYSSIDVVFLRPNPDAIIRRTGSSTNYQSGYICISSPANGSKRKIFINNTGQISVSIPGNECN